MFRKNSKQSQSSKPVQELTKIVSPQELQAEAKRMVLLTEIREGSKLDDSRYSSLCASLLNTLCQYYQSLPETAHSFYSQPGGLLDHALHRTEAALTLFNEVIIPATQTELSEEQKLWQYALLTAALLKGVGKLVIDFDISIFDTNGVLLKDWNPLQESLSVHGRYYDFEFSGEEQKEMRKRLNLLLARQIMPVSGFNWIASNQDVLCVWLALLNEDERSAGTLGTVLIRAETVAIQRYFNELILLAKAMGGRGRGGSFMGKQTESILPKEQMVGIEFLQWLTNAIAEGRIEINKPPLLMVPGGLLMCPEIFQLFIRSHPEYINWLAIQKGLLSLGLHQSNNQGEIETKFQQVQTQKIYSGVLFSDYGVVLPESMNVFNNSLGKSQQVSALDLINNADFINQFTRSNTTTLASSLMQLNEKGQWLPTPSVLAANKVGVGRSV